MKPYKRPYGGTPGPPVMYEKPSDPEDDGAGYGYTNAEAIAENDIYFYHPDHLGSSSFITNIEGEVVQHIEYVPYGEVLIEERNNVWNTPYLFNAKEFDEETGLYYYGARYYDTRMAIFLTTDRYAEKYPWQSAYSYAGGNPVRFIDVNGDSIRFADDRAKDIFNEYYGAASEKRKSEIDKVQNSSNIYTITVGGLDEEGNKVTGGYTYRDGESTYRIDIEDVGEYTVGLLADELKGAHQNELGEVAFVYIDGRYFPKYYDLADEVATKYASIEALEKKGLKIQDMPTAGGAISAEFGRLYDKYNGNIPERQLRKWGRFKNSKGESYRQLFREYGGHNSMRRLTYAK